jgi:XRE family transcriptional regulator, regulator of sulfur utilization
MLERMARFHVLAPRIEVSVGKTIRKLKAGDAARYFADQPHAIGNGGKHEAAALLAVIHT